MFSDYDIETIPMPAFRWISIPTKGKSTWEIIKIWWNKPRKMQLTEDYLLSHAGKVYMVPEGTIIDGASVPRFLWVFAAPNGLLGVPALFHDYAYQNAEVLIVEGDIQIAIPVNKNQADELFRDMAADINGFDLLADLAYYGVRVGGQSAWDSYR